MAQLESEFDASAFQHVVLIYLARIYDLLTVQGNPAGIAKMVEEHSKGNIIGPAPSFSIPADSD